MDIDRQKNIAVLFLVLMFLCVPVLSADEYWMGCQAYGGSHKAYAYLFLNEISDNVIYTTIGMCYSEDTGTAKVSVRYLDENSVEHLETIRYCAGGNSSTELTFDLDSLAYDFDELIGFEFNCSYPSVSANELVDFKYYENDGSVKVAYCEQCIGGWCTSYKNYVKAHDERAEQIGYGTTNVYTHSVMNLPYPMDFKVLEADYCNMSSIVDSDEFNFTIIQNANAANKTKIEEIVNSSMPVLMNFDANVPANLNIFTSIDTSPVSVQIDNFYDPDDLLDNLVEEQQFGQAQVSDFYYYPSGVAQTLKTNSTAMSSGYDARSLAYSMNITTQAEMFQFKKVGKTDYDVVVNTDDSAQWSASYVTFFNNLMGYWLGIVLDPTGLIELRPNVANDRRDTTIKVGWDSVTEADAYQVSIASEGYSEETTSLSHTISGLSPETKYTVIVKTKDDGDYSAGASINIWTYPFMSGSSLTYGVSEDVTVSKAYPSTNFNSPSSCQLTDSCNYLNVYGNVTARQNVTLLRFVIPEPSLEIDDAYLYLKKKDMVHTCTELMTSTYITISYDFDESTETWNDYPDTSEGFLSMTEVDTTIGVSDGWVKVPLVYYYLVGDETTNVRTLFLWCDDAALVSTSFYETEYDSEVYEAMIVLEPEDINPPEFSNATITPDPASMTIDAVVTIEIDDQDTSLDVSFDYEFNGVSQSVQYPINITATTWEVTLPATGQAGTICYEWTATDDDSNEGTYNDCFEVVETNQWSRIVYFAPKPSMTGYVEGASGLDDIGYAYYPYYVEGYDVYLITKYQNNIGNPITGGLCNVTYLSGFGNTTLSGTDPQYQDIGYVVMSETFYISEGEETISGYIQNVGNMAVGNYTLHVSCDEVGAYAEKQALVPYAVVPEVYSVSLDAVGEGEWMSIDELIPFVMYYGNNFPQDDVNYDSSRMTDLNCTFRVNGVNYTSTGVSYSLNASSFVPNLYYTVQGYCDSVTYGSFYDTDYFYLTDETSTFMDVAYYVPTFAKDNLEVCAWYAEPDFTNYACGEFVENAECVMQALIEGGEGYAELDLEKDLGVLESSGLGACERLELKMYSRDGMYGYCGVWTYEFEEAHPFADISCWKDGYMMQNYRMDLNFYETVDLNVTIQSPSSGAVVTSPDVAVELIIGGCELCEPYTSSSRCDVVIRDNGVLKVNAPNKPSNDAGDFYSYLVDGLTIGTHVLEVSSWCHGSPTGLGLVKDSVTINVEYASPTGYTVADDATEGVLGSVGVPWVELAVQSENPSNCYLVRKDATVTKNVPFSVELNEYEVTKAIQAITGETGETPVIDSILCSFEQKWFYWWPFPSAYCNYQTPDVGQDELLPLLNNYTSRMYVKEVIFDFDEKKFIEDIQDETLYDTSLFMDGVYGQMKMRDIILHPMFREEIADRYELKDWGATVASYRLDAGSHSIRVWKDSVYGEVDRAMKNHEYVSVEADGRPLQPDFFTTITTCDLICEDDNQFRKVVYEDIIFHHNTSRNFYFGEDLITPNNIIILIVIMFAGYVYLKGKQGQSVMNVKYPVMPQIGKKQEK